MYLYNGNIVSEISIEASNRAFKYGDAFFETMLYHEGSIPLFDLHFERATKTFPLLKMQLPNGFLKDEFKSLLLNFLATKRYTTAKVRISFWRDGEGTYFTTEDTSSYLIEAASITSKPFELNKEGQTLGIYRDTFKNTDFLANVKVSGCLTYILASSWVKEQEVDDAILLNHHGRVAECTSSNIFLVFDNEIITPSLSEGCLDGVMRRHLLNTLPKQGYTVKEQTIELTDIEKANEIFTTNALGIKWIEKVENIEKKYQNNSISKFIIAKD
ncbi:MAG: aminotransferase class IV [bacterium]